MKCCYACQPLGKARLSNPQPSAAHFPFRSVLWCIHREFKPSFHFIIQSVAPGLTQRAGKQPGHLPPPPPTPKLGSQDTGAEVRSQETWVSVPAQPGCHISHLYQVSDLSGNREPITSRLGAQTLVSDARGSNQASESSNDLTVVMVLNLSEPRSAPSSSGGGSFCLPTW